ncbi:helix-turn-helix transcriptional regulator [Kitasatospora sp. SUK 42]|uniref:helix-turn-helix transcriptional regulator n=1 Tax=Kitasatospora sp. SUK 42 TaxID=1588882 RepID=UPI0018CAED4F|nr:helix-turn-helix transcriptional regulator [Kitasatospora sp. SUK 42]MBV2151551.1 helix-turn-helix transcriptional regulator [Kitasatospora sp. SUK 42]
MGSKGSQGSEGSGSELGEFLRLRRAAVTPAELDLRVPSEHRRVAGLRREELAGLAGISLAYYTRLEQGRSTNASDQVLDAIARVLRLDATQRAHLYDLARRPPRAVRRRPPAEQPHPRSVQLLEALHHLPALLLGRRNDVLAWNPLGHALLAGHLPYEAPADPATRPSMSRMLFLDPHTRELERDWEHYARTHVGYLRLVAGRYGEDRALAELIGELTMKSQEFAAWWAGGNVRECTFGSRVLDHPVVGPVEVTYQVWLQPDRPDHRLELYTPGPDPAAADALALLEGRLEPPQTARASVATARAR